MSDHQCRICRSVSLEIVWELTPSPYGDLFRESAQEAKSLPMIGLTLILCRECGHLQLAEEVDAEEIYSDYIYQSSVTAGLATYYRRLTGDLVARLHLGESDLVVDVGSNDGTGLKPFVDAGTRVLGIEPSRVPARIALGAGIPTINDFLGEESLREVLSNHGRAKLVCANYVAANVPHPVDFLRTLGSMVAPGGAVSIVTGYHPDQFAVNMFDYINHDHLSYFTVSSASRLADASGLRLVSADRIEHKGGSIHLLFRPSDSSGEPDESVSKLIQRERWLGTDMASTYASLATRVGDAAQSVRRLLEASPSGVAGVGASISTTHLLLQFGIGSMITQLFDDDPGKAGRYSPGLGLPVRPLDELASGGTPSAVLLAWQHTDSLLRRMHEVGFAGRVVVPLPNPQTILLS